MGNDTQYMMLYTISNTFFHTTFFPSELMLVAYNMRHYRTMIFDKECMAVKQEILSLPPNQFDSQ